MLSILLTGATGFIGSHLITELTGKGFGVAAIVRNKDKLKTNKSLKIVEANLLTEYFSPRGKWDVLVHLADIMPGKKTTYFLENLTMNLNLIKNVVYKGLVKRIIYASTIDVYGKPKYLPMDENHPIEPESYYAATKACNERLLMIASKEKNIPLCILRLSHVYGPGDVPLKAIPIFMENIKSREPITIYGDGSDRRDYVYVKDILDAIAAALHFKNSCVYNVATGESHTLLEVVHTIEQKLQRKVKIVFKKRRNEKTEIEININKIKQDLHFTPKYNIKKGLYQYLRSEKCQI